MMEGNDYQVYVMNPTIGRGLSEPGLGLRWRMEHTQPGCSLRSSGSLVPSKGQPSDDGTDELPELVCFQHKHCGHVDDAPQQRCNAGGH